MKRKQHHGPAHLAANRRYQSRIRELRPIMAAKGWKYVAGCWVPAR